MDSKVKETLQCTFRIMSVGWKMDGQKYIHSHYLPLEKRTWRRASGRILLTSVSSSFQLWKWVQFEKHLLCGISESAGSNNSTLEPGPFLLLIAATCVVGKGPLPAPVALEHIQNRPHSRWASTASSAHTLIAKAGASGWSVGCTTALCSC